MKAQCPVCKAECKVSEKRTQATREEPSKVIGKRGYCPACDVSFKPLVYVRAMG